MDRETDSMCTYLTSLFISVLCLHLNQVNLTMSSSKALVDSIVVNGIIPSDAPPEGEGSGYDDKSGQEVVDGELDDLPSEEVKPPPPDEDLDDYPCTSRSNATLVGSARERTMTHPPSQHALVLRTPY